MVARVGASAFIPTWPKPLHCWCRGVLLACDGMRCRRREQRAPRCSPAVAVRACAHEAALQGQLLTESEAGAQHLRTGRKDERTERFLGQGSPRGVCATAAAALGHRPCTWISNKLEGRMCRGHGGNRQAGNQQQACRL